MIFVGIFGVTYRFLVAFLGGALGDDAVDPAGLFSRGVGDLDVAWGVRDLDVARGA